MNYFDKMYDKLVSLFSPIYETKSRQNVLWGVVILLTFGLLLFLNILTPMIADDFGYLYIFGEKTQVSSLGDLIQSQKNHYYMWGGRSVVHFVAQGLLQMPRLLVNFLNASVYLLFIYLIYLHIKGLGKRSLSLFVVVDLSVWLIIPKLGDTILWTTGSANYLWGTTIVLLFLLPYRLYQGGSISILKQIIYSLLMFLVGILTGWTNENTVVGMVAIIILLFLYYRSLKWTIPAHFVIGLVGVLVGYAFMILAPGNYVRAGESASLGVFIVIYRLFTHTSDLILDYGVLNLFYLVILVLFSQYGLGSKRKGIQLSLIYFLGVLACVYVMIFSPSFPARAWFGAVTYNIIAVGIILFRFDYSQRLLAQLRLITISVAFIAFVFTFYIATKDIYRFYTIDKQREVLAKEARERGDEFCVFEMFSPRSKYIHGEDSATQYLMSYYYGIKIKFEE